MNGYGHVPLTLYLQKQIRTGLAYRQLFADPCSRPVNWVYIQSLLCTWSVISSWVSCKDGMRGWNNWEFGGLEDLELLAFFFFNVVCRLISFDYHAVNILITISLKQILASLNLYPLWENVILMYWIALVRLFIDDTDNNELYIIAALKCFFTSARN